MVAGRNDDAIADALRMLAGSFGQIPHANAGNRNGDDDEYRALRKFQRDNPPIFEGEHEPDKAQAWLKRFDEEGIQVSWDLFCNAFLENYFPEDCHGKKEVEFLELEQGNGTVAEYSARFQELIKESASHYKAMNEKKVQYRGKPYDNKKKAGFGRKPSGGGSSAPIKCFKCSVEGHRAVNCSKVEVTCFMCGKSGHKIGVKEDLFLSAKQVDESVQDGVELFMLLAILDVHEKRTIEEFPIVCDIAEKIAGPAKQSWSTERSCKNGKLLPSSAGGPLSGPCCMQSFPNFEMS
ncbi:uncharacterized protein LOC131604216 [Vicia villosa]|uniref:uncharacterized protein LOC131604216 n=1 Tax=Vicia villosa TaxID=3911 RepID=UPI00273C1E8C|nr:uncharacterized protein LOC131604216 [Vicia villosa]